MSSEFSRRDVMKSFGLGALALAMSASSETMAAEVAASGAKETPVPYELPPLPYAYGALAPTLDEKTVRIHHDKHHAACVKALNSTLAGLEEARKAGDYGTIRALSRDLAFTGSGHVLHTLYWNGMKPGGAGEPQGDLRAAIERDFGSFGTFKAQFIAATKAVEGSGWGVLAYEPVGRRLVVLQAEKHQNLTIWGAVPLMACDVWEHAYYLQYENRRQEYVDAFFGIIDWPSVAKRLAAAGSA